MSILHLVEKGSAQWTRLFSATAVLPGYRRKRVEQPRLFWNAYWGLLDLGITPGQLADYAVTWGYHYGPLRDDVALVRSVMALADEYAIKRPEYFSPPLSSV